MNHRLTLCSAAAHADALLGRLMLCGAPGFEWRDAAVDPAIPADEVQLITYGERSTLEALLEAAGALPGLRAAPSITAVDPIDWAESWKAHFKPLRLSPRLVVVPSWERYQAATATCIIKVDPGSAFGTGQHATTALCARALDQRAAEHTLGTVLDFGCGTGILAIAADLLGADALTLIDNDPLAVDVATENLSSQGMASPYTLACAERPPDGATYDTVIANILAPVLIEHARALAANVADDGCLLLSGLLTRQIDEVLAAYAPHGLTQRRLSCEGEWALLWLER